MEKHERLKLARQRHFATAKEAAASLGVPYGTYSGHELGSRGFKSDELALYARRFHVSRAWLAFGEGEPDDGPQDRPIPAEEHEPSAGGADPAGRELTLHPGPPSPTRSPPVPDRIYIQVELGALRDLLSGVLQSESIPEEQADAYAAAVLELLRARSSASLVPRLEEPSRSAAVSPTPEPDDRS